MLLVCDEQVTVAMTIFRKQFKVWMIQFIVTILFLVHATFASANTNNQQLKTIEVTGSAEMYIQPDEIKLEIVIETRSGMSRKNEFLKILHKNKVTIDMLEFKQMSSNWWYYYYNNYNKTEQVFVLLIDSTVHALHLMNDLSKPWVKRINVIEESNYKIQDYRKDVKIEAIKAAKEKASYLLEAIGESIGEAVTITEKSNDYSYWDGGNVYSNSTVSSSKSVSRNLEGIAIQKLRYEVKVIFSIT